MAPRGGAGRSEVAEPQGYFALGVRGRKTGAQLKDTGNRDEHGMQPLDDLSSSPEREPASPPRSDDDNEDNNHDETGENEDDDQGSEDMDIETSFGPGPQTVLRKSMIPLPRSRSPIKTGILSSPRRNPNLEHLSSPSRSPARSPAPKDRDNTVTRKIDFGAKPTGRGKSATNGTNGTLHEEEEEEIEDVPGGNDEMEDDVELLNESIQLVDDMGGHSSEQGSEPESEAEPEPVPVPVPKAAKASAKSNQEKANVDPKKTGRRGRPPKAKAVEQEPVEEEPVEEKSTEEEPEEPQETAKLAKGRPGRKPKNDVQPKTSNAPPSRKRPALEEAEETEEQENEESEQEQGQAEPPRQVKKQRTEAPKPSKPAKPAPSKATSTAETKKPRGRPGRKPKAPAIADAGDDVGETSFAALQRGPPLPKKRGLVSVRHDADEVHTTRSGRHSFKPLSWWAGDKVVQEEEEFKDVSGRDRFVLSTIKEVIRAPVEEVRAKPSKPRGRPGKAKSKATRQVEAVEPEDWELDPGTVNGEVILWDPEHEKNPPGDEEPVEVMDDRIAISGQAIQTRDVQGVSFRMAKTLTTPFMGAGVVDLPAGSEKRPKNSRKMHMVFFVHTGKVLVTVNEASFRLSAGGMWFVPRGNYYSITNDYDTDSRIFFTQGCEAATQSTEPDQSQMSMMA